MSSSALGPLAAPSAQKGSCSRRLLEAGVGPQLPRPADGPLTHTGPSAGGAAALDGTGPRYRQGPREGAAGTGACAAAPARRDPLPAA
jgi:hypothetical protein